MIARHDRLVVNIAVYNEARFIERTLRSVLDQTDDDFAVLIADNASTDATGEIVRDVIAGDPRFHYHRHAENGGAVFNYNFALEQGQSPFFMWLGGHDRITPGFVATHLAALAERPGCSLSYSLVDRIDEADERIRTIDPSRLADIAGSPVQRYLRSIPRLADCTAINQMIRRDAAAGARLSPVAAADHVFLSHLLFHGPAHRDTGERYLRRVIGGTREDYMARMMGKKGLRPDASGPIAAYRDDFAALPLPDHDRARAERRLARTLSRRFEWHRWPDRWLEVQARRLHRRWKASRRT